MSIGVCDPCGELFAGEFLQIHEAPCPNCGKMMREATPDETREYARTWRERGTPHQGHDAGENGDERVTPR